MLQAIGVGAKLLGIDIGGIANNVVQKMFPGDAGKMLGGVAQGLGSFFQGDIFGALKGGMQAFQGLGGGLGQLLGGGGAGGIGGFGGFPQLPGMGGGFGVPGFGGGGLTGGIPGFGGGMPGFGGGPGGDLFGQLKGMQDIASNPNAMMEMAKDPGKMMAFQQKMQELQSAFQLMSNLSKKMHDISMDILRKI